MIQTMYLVLLTYSFFRGTRGNFRIVLSLLKLNKLYLQVFKNKTRKLSNTTKFTLLIPVLREQGVIVDCIRQLANIKGDVDIRIVTTQREEYEKDKLKFKLSQLKSKIEKAANLEQLVQILNGILPANIVCKIWEAGNNWQVVEKTFDELPSTKEVIEEELNKIQSSNISVIHYPEVAGNKANQLNYAISQIEKSVDPDNNFLLFYDVDSIISEDLIVRLKNYLESYPQANVIQQSALFLSNYHNLSKGWRKSFLQSIALLQSRWTLAHELPRIFTQFETRVGSFLEGSHLVAHGLFIRISLLKKVGYFPSEKLTEDLPLGYLVRLLGEKIYPFPVLENTQSPITVKGMFNMYENWFFGVVSYFNTSFSNVLKKLPDVRSLIWGLTYLVRGILWLFMSFAWLFILLYPLLVGNMFYLFLSLLSFLIYSPLSFVILIWSFNHNPHLIAQKKQMINLDLSVLVYTLAAYLTHSLGPVQAVYKLAMSLLFRQRISRKKTER
jgi:cellulose synthase/poly-beta-1,6-N-acetylglucosamine synthase-like glycosyltransferase